ncbi:MAG: putative rane protein [Herbinix sp.]|nr:putative rane protein [Herbinix sp.]
MSKINTFLQKRKMTSGQCGIIMMIVAYALSFILLVVGSDCIFSISSSAAGIGDKSDEVTKQISADNEEEMSQINFYPYCDPSVVETKLENLSHFKLNKSSNVQEEKGESSVEILSQDTYWMFGNAMDTKEYSLMQAQIEEVAQSLIENEKKEKEEKQQKEKEEKEKKEEDTIESFSTSDKATTSVYSASKEEVKMLERIVEAEASGEDMIGKILVANVILNRTQDDEFADTIEGVIFQKVNGEYQFSPISDERYWSVKISKETKEAVKRALSGEDYSEGAVYFMARKSTKSSSAKWFDRNLEWLFKHGGHEFFKDN